MALANLVLSVVLGVLISVDLSFGKPADQYFHLCRRSSPDFEKCIQKTIMEAKPILMKGIPEIKFPQMEPLYQAKVALKEGNGNFKFSLNLADAYMAGLSKMTIESVKITGNPDSDMTMKINLKTPQLSLTSKYAINGRILIVPVDGKGDMSLNFTQPTMKVMIKAHPVASKKDGEKYLSLDSLTIDMRTKGGKVHLGNLFNGDKALGRTTNAFFNDNFMDLFGALKHMPEEFFTSSLKPAVQAVFDSFTVEELFPQ